MQLILMRHALADERSSRYPDDALRPLSNEGKRKHRAVSDVMRRMAIQFDRLVSSPLVRARETAEITADVYGWREDIEETDALGSGFSVPALCSFLEAEDEKSTVLCVGHEPDFSTFAANLLHASGEVEIDFKKSGVMGLDLPQGPRAGSGVLLYFLKPGQVARLAP